MKILKHIRLASAWILFGIGCIPAALSVILAAVFIVIIGIFVMICIAPGILLAPRQNLRFAYKDGHMSFGFNSDVDDHDDNNK
jgi:type IV secretory pathway VirB3-like protein